VIIPARLASERFPLKVLASETGRPLVQHVVDRVRGVADVCVAADDVRIVEALETFGTRVLLTSPTHRSGTERVAEAADQLGLGEDAVVVNVQGDEPEVEPDAVSALLDRMADSDEPAMATAVVPFPSSSDASDPALVKAVLDAGRRRCLWFSRSPIPFERSGPVARFLHVGLYGYRVEFLRRLRGLPPTPAEVAESLEQLRVLEHGESIGCVVRGHHAGGIDTAEQYRAFVQRHAGTGSRT